jgi:hypothetical protein
VIRKAPGLAAGLAESWWYTVVAQKIVRFNRFADDPWRTFLPGRGVHDCGHSEACAGTGGGGVEGVRVRVRVRVSASNKDFGRIQWNRLEPMGVWVGVLGLGAGFGVAGIKAVFNRFSAAPPLHSAV